MRYRDVPRARANHINRLSRSLSPESDAGQQNLSAASIPQQDQLHELRSHHGASLSAPTQRHRGWEVVSSSSEEGDGAAGSQPCLTPSPSRSEGSLREILQVSAESKRGNGKAREKDESLPARASPELKTDAWLAVAGQLRFW